MRLVREVPTLSTNNTGRYRLAVDIGGTFTDVVLLAPDGSYWTKKVSSTPEDYAVGIIEGVAQVLNDTGLDGSAVLEIIHGTTVASNTILENKGAKTALITTRGFRDVLELRRLRVPQLYSVFYEPPTPLVERRLRLEVDERVDSGGAVITTLSEDDVETALDRIEEDGAESVAVCFLHSYRNPAHERRVGEAIRERLPDIYVSLSVDVLPEIREYERTSTTVVNSYLGPIVKNYLDSLADQLGTAEISAPVHIMQSNGGIMSARQATETPVKIVESGPAAGVVGGDEIGKRVGLQNLITFDMGGTTAKASLIEDGRRSWTTEHEIGAGISLSSRLVKGGGHAIKVPVMDLAEVGAGGGSIVWIDRGGALRVGPRSAGAMPGPACYDTGGTEPTVTDANVVLGYVNPRRLAGGAVELRPELARRVLDERVAGPLGMETLEAAYGVHTVANVTMIRAIRAVSTYRGRDPRDFSMLAFGGSGPIHAVAMARSLSVATVIVPPASGVFSAVGLLQAQAESHFVLTFFGRLSQVDPETLDGAYGTMKERAEASLVEEGYSAADLVWQRSADLRYVGQAYELTVQAPGDRLGASGVILLEERFHEEHERTYGHKAPGESVEMVNLRLTARAASSQSLPTTPIAGADDHERTSRDVYFGPDHGSLETAIVSRSDLADRRLDGPLVVEEYDVTTVVPPGSSAQLDEWSNIVIDVG